MSLTLPPRALYMILSDDVISSDDSPRKHHIVGLTTLVRWPEGLTVPVRIDKLSAFLVLTGGRGTGNGQIVCFNEETGVEIFRFPKTPLPVSFEGKDSAGHHGLIFRALGCPFPQPGVYVLRFLFDDNPVCEQSITVR
jgi:hypothetical protein